MLAVTFAGIASPLAMLNHSRTQSAIPIIGICIEGNRVIELLPQGKAAQDGRIQVDDELIAIDDEDVSQLQASTISQKMLWADYRQTRKLTFRRMLVGRGQPSHIFDVVLHRSADPEQTLYGATPPRRSAYTDTVSVLRPGTVRVSRSVLSPGDGVSRTSQVQQTASYSPHASQHGKPYSPEHERHANDLTHAPMDSLAYKEANSAQAHAVGMKRFSNLSLEVERLLGFLRGGGFEKPGAMESHMVDSPLLLSEQTEAAEDLRSLYLEIKRKVDEKELLAEKVRRLEERASKQEKGSVEEMHGDVQDTIVGLMKNLEKTKTDLKEFRKYHEDAMRAKEAETIKLKKAANEKLQEKDKEVESAREELSELKQKFRRNSTTDIKMLDQDVHQLKVINKSKEKEVEHLQEQIQGLEEEMRSRDERLKTVLVGIQNKQQEDERKMHELRALLAERDSFIALLQGKKAPT